MQIMVWGRLLGTDHKGEPASFRLAEQRQECQSWVEVPPPKAAG